MKPGILYYLIVLVAVVAGCIVLFLVTMDSPPASSAASLTPHTPPADNPNPPTTTVKLIFIHHSCGENWLADDNGGLGIALRDNNYFVSDTNYGWGPDAIGDRTDIPDWPEWFVGPNALTYTTALYTEYNQHSSYSRLDSDPGGENQIVMFKSCFPNSDLEGNPDDPPLATPDGSLTVANAKAVYNTLLTYFATRQDKLFIVITAPPLAEGDTTAAHAANARAFNNWLMNNWLSGYTHHNVAVFDFYNVLTSNGGDANTNDYDQRPIGNHHYWTGSMVTHTQTLANNYSAYPSGDSHPTAAGNLKATAEFVPLLNVFYNRWKGSVPSCVALTDAAISGPTSGYTGTPYTFTAIIMPASASTPIMYTWAPAPASEQGTATARYTWPTTGTKTITLTVQNCGGSDMDTHTIVIAAHPAPSHFAYLPLVLRSYSTAPPIGGLVQPADLVYLGAFRLPDDGERPQTFAYGGNAMTYNPDNNTLFITGHDRLPYGELPDGDQVAEVSIPTPVNSRNVEDLPVATFVQGFHNPTAGHFTSLDEIPKVGLEYLNHPDTGPKIHITWGRHLQQLEDYLPSQGWFDPDLENPDFQGEWFIGDRNPNSVNGYMFGIPAAWADTHVQGRYLATGRFSPGGLGGMGPALLAYRPWLTGGVAPISGTHLAETAFLLYESAMVTDVVTHCLDTYQHADAWEGGAWLTTPSGKSAVLFAGTKGTGIKYWYGYIHPTNPLSPCVDLAVLGDFYPCRLADGTECPETDLVHCCEEGVDCVSARGWWSTRFDAQFILYDPAQLAQVAAGTLETWQPQPYAVIDVDAYLYLNPPEWDEFEVGWGDQRRHRIGDATFDRVNGRLYVLELYADGGKPVVHVWRVE